MSRAFVKESESVDELPDRLISDHPNYTTPNGLRLIQEALDTRHAALARAQVIGDREAISSIVRDLRYWERRRATAIVVAPPTDTDHVRFGSVIIIKRAEGKRSYQIVGEDEADPTQNTLSYVSPLAKALIGKAVGEALQIGDAQVELIGIELPKSVD